MIPYIYGEEFHVALSGGGAVWVGQRMALAGILFGVTSRLRDVPRNLFSVARQSVKLWRLGREIKAHKREIKRKRDAACADYIRQRRE